MARGCSLGVTPKCMKVMLAMGVPLVMLHLLDYVAENSSGVPRNLSCLDLFSGQMSVFNGFCQESMRAEPYDNVLHPKIHDFTSTMGFVRATQLTLRLAEDALLHAGPPCNSFIWVSRGTTLRSKKNPEGDTKAPSVQLGNLITSRLCLLLIVCFARSVYFCVEQPRSSVMKHFKHLKELATMLSDLGNDVIKFRIQNLPWIGELYQRLPRKVQKRLKRKASLEMVIHYRDSKGAKKVKGGKGLKKSAAYPPEYGQKVASTHRKYIENNPKQLRKVVSDQTDMPDLKYLLWQAAPMSSWSMAKLEPIHDFLCKERQEGRYHPKIKIGL